jgi:hypothetical protein
MEKPVIEDPFQNPFLDPYLVPRGGTLSNPGEPLNRIEVPPIHTLIYKASVTFGLLASVNINDALLRAGITPQQPVLVRDAIIGIELNLNLPGTAAPPSASFLSPAQLQTGQTVGKIIPTNLKEAYNVRHMINAQRTGNRNVSFDINELKQISKNLNLSASGNKDVLANRINTAINAYYNIIT